MTFAPESMAFDIRSCHPSSNAIRTATIASVASHAASKPEQSQPQGRPGVSVSSIILALGNWDALDPITASITGATYGESSSSLSTRLASKHAIVSISAADDATTLANCSVPKSPGGRSNTNGTWMVNISGVGPVILPSESNVRCIGLLPISTAVPISSLPWIPSLLGLTISDMSVSMPSNPGPPNLPRYP